MKVLYFAWLRERVGTGEEEISFPDDIITIRDALGYLKARDERYDYAFTEIDTVRAALDQDHAELDAPLGSARELALFPPMTGG